MRGFGRPPSGPPALTRARPSPFGAARGGPPRGRNPVRQPFAPAPRRTSPPPARRMTRSQTAAAAAGEGMYYGPPGRAYRPNYRPNLRPHQEVHYLDDIGYDQQPDYAEPMDETYVIDDFQSHEFSSEGGFDSHDQYYQNDDEYMEDPQYDDDYADEQQLYEHCEPSEQPQL